MVRAGSLCALGDMFVCLDRKESQRWAIEFCVPMGETERCEIMLCSERGENLSGGR